MKLLFITSLKDYQKNIAQIMNEAGITIFSVTETIGFKDHHTPNLLDNWFSRGSEQFDSIFLFSFTDEVKANEVVSLIKKYNTEHETGFPIRAFVLAVERTS